MGWAEGDPCRKHALSFCASCKPGAKGGEVVYVSRGKGSTFHKFDGCAYLLAGQDAVVDEGGKRGRVEPMLRYMAMEAGKRPCKGCFGSATESKAIPTQSANPAPSRRNAASNGAEQRTERPAYMCIARGRLFHRAGALCEVFWQEKRARPSPEHRANEATMIESGRFPCAACIITPTATVADLLLVDTQRRLRYLSSLEESGS